MDQQPRSYVEFAGVEKSYDGRTLAVKRLDLTIARGEFLTFLGPSGSGKTTTLNMLAGLERPTRGTITLDGRSVDALPPYERNIGMVFQSYALFPHMSVADRAEGGTHFRSRYFRRQALPRKKSAPLVPGAKP
jgi:putative spermidine/putrescine transport system ATP-binding protein